MSALLAPWKKPATSDHVECLKWSHGNTKYEIFISVLDNLELMFLSPHCLDAKEKIEQVVSDAHLGQALFIAFPRTVSTVLRTIWDVMLQDSQRKPKQLLICVFVASSIHTLQQMIATIQSISFIKHTNLDKSSFKTSFVDCEKLMDAFDGSQEMSKNLIKTNSSKHSSIPCLSLGENDLNKQVNRTAK
jgi:hypothetical protein